MTTTTSGTKASMEQTSHCVQVPERKSAYESQMATQQALLDLGKSLDSREKKQQSREEKHAYLMSTVKDLEDFNGNIFVDEYEKSKDDNLLKAKVYSLVRYISIFKDLHKSTSSNLEEALTKVSELTNEIAYQRAQIDSYIIQLDELDEFIVCKTNTVIQFKKELKNLRDTIDYRETHLLLRLSEDKCRNIRNKVLIWSLVIAHISTLTYLHIF
jgi:predicted metalloendopeptidase